MVKCHKTTGTPRHFRKNQRKYATMKNGASDAGHCDTCIFSGRASGDRYFGGYSIGWICFNKASKKYMLRIRSYDSCSKYKMK